MLMAVTVDTQPTADALRTALPEALQHPHREVRPVAMSVVFDSSALLAIAFNERGAEQALIR